MRIVIDMQGAQSESRFRGIGRYTISFAQAVVRNRCNHEVLLALNGLLPDNIEAIRAAFEGLLPQENIRVWFAPGPVCERRPGNDSRREVAELMRESFLLSLQPDVIHISSLFEGFVDDAVSSIGKHDLDTFVSATLFDLIPLLNSHSYLSSDPLYSAYYLRKINWLNQAACLLAISNSAQQEGLQSLSLPEDCILNVSTAIEPCFRPISINDEDAEHFFRRLGIVRPFILHTGGCDDRKNLFRLIEAYAGLPLELRQRYQLVLAGKMTEGFEFRLLQTAKSLRLQSDEVHLAGYVNDSDLIWLYNLCKLYVFPSWHEGFGLPALEAMACGAPVVAANTSSLPEVVGLDEALFDPFNIVEMTDKIKDGLENKFFINLLKDNSRRQAKKFSWDISAQRAIRAWQHFHDRKKKNNLLTASSSSRQLIEALVDRLKDNNDATMVALAASIALNRQAGVERQLFVDISEIVRHNAATGVQRVVNSYLRCLLDAPPPGFRVEPVYASRDTGYFYAQSHSLLFQGIFSFDKNDPPICWQRGDIFFGLDMQHHIQLAHADFYQRLRCDGVTVKFLIYDLLPIQYPDLFCRSNLGRLHAKLLAMIADTDGAICISKTTADSYVEWMQDNLPSKPFLPVDWVHIGADLHISKDIENCSASELKILPLIQARIAFLCVATLEPRKGQEQILHAMEQLWLEGGDYNLVLVGQQGWKTEKLAERLQDHPELGRRLFWLQCVSDAFLERIYSVCTCLIAASRNEGFGLPLIEAARYGIPIIARDIPVFREVAGSHAFFFSGVSPSDLALAIKQWLAICQDGHQPNSRLISWSTWYESTQKLCNSLLGRGYSRRQLFVDISELVQHDANTGIQRVVRNVLMQWLLDPPRGWQVAPVYASADQGYRYARRFTTVFLGKQCAGINDDPIEYAPGDVFFCLDLNPQVQTASAAFYQHLRQQGVTVKFFVYDLLCIQQPEYFPPGSAEHFTNWLQVVGESDGVVCISKTVAVDLAEWMRSKSWNRTRKFSVLWNHLGADMSVTASSSSNCVRGLFLGKVFDCPSFLMVGTIEPRKGYSEVLDAFELLWQNNTAINLIVVGKKGWMVAALVDRIRSHPELGRRLFWLEGISDEYLSQIYGLCSCLIAASHGEGFGLPLIEAAQHSLPIFARDIPIFREVAGDYAYYFSVCDASGLALQIQEWLLLYNSDSHPKSECLPWLSWSVSAVKLAAYILSDSD
jgi:glycosyltransferase involved in cell wall biosynthesis